MEVPHGKGHRAVRAPQGPGGFLGALCQHARAAGRQSTQLPKVRDGQTRRHARRHRTALLPYLDIYFDDMERLQSSLSTPEGQTPPNDLPNFATGGVTIFISEVDS